MIKLLTKDVTEKIAAGEVIESPASVIKELLENSIDAGSSRITVEIEGSGRNFIEITDDGSGMSKEDLALSVERFATSKISCFEDLDSIKTLGFRGEALPSIGAVSKLEIETKIKDQSTGHYLLMEGGKINLFKEIPASCGTRIKVSSIFFNTPARLKFLASPSSEVTKITDLIFKFSLYYKNIHFRLINAKKEILNLLPNTEIPHRLHQLWGISSKDFMEIAGKNPVFEINGFMTLPKINKVNRKYQIFFLNGRLIKSPLISQAITEAYSGFMERNRFPLAVLFFNVDGKFVDVNVHPTKNEVKFQNNREVFSFINKIIKTAFCKLRESSNFEPVLINSTPQSPLKFKNGSRGAITMEHYLPIAMPDEVIASATPLGFIQFKNSYILTSDEEQIWIIDQHAASEKITFERLKKAILEPENIFFQKLLTPKVINLSGEQYEAYGEVKKILELAGFQTELFEGSSILVRTAPSYVKIGEIEKIIHDILDDLAENSSKAKTNIKEKFLESLACHSSIRNGQKLSQDEMKSLFEKIIKNPEYNFCPHGRPVFLKYDIKSLDKIFKRT